MYQLAYFVSGQWQGFYIWTIAEAKQERPAIGFAEKVGATPTAFYLRSVGYRTNLISINNLPVLAAADYCELRPVFREHVETEAAEDWVRRRGVQPEEWEDQPKEGLA